MGNTTNTFYFGDNEPIINIYSAGTLVTTLSNRTYTYLPSYERDLRLNQSYTIGWTWSKGSGGKLPSTPGNYSVSAKWSSEEHEKNWIYFDLETPGVPMQVLSK